MSVMNPKIQINIESEKKRFNEHINIKGNNNIFFSGVFGSGKTYFLEKFFNENPQYECYIISPVKYSISPSDNIFSYIKYDIGITLFSKDISFDKTDYSLTQTSGLYYQNNYLEFLDHLLYVGSRVDQELNLIEKFVSYFKKIFKKLTVYNKDINIDDKKELHKFLFSLTTQRNSLYEEDLITQMISHYIGLNDKEKVLIIDDLDRLDPDHIFRLLNVFSSHLEIEKSEINKLGFTKLILVGDLNNIRRIYHHRFGQDVDFEGYFDKFYSTEIFYLNNLSSTLDTMSDILKEILPGDKQNPSDPFYRIIEFILLELLHNTKFNLRSLLNLVNVDYEMSIKQLTYKRQIKYCSKNYVVYEVFLFLTRLIGDHNKVLKLFEEYIVQKPLDNIKSEDLRDYRHFLSYDCSGDIVGGETKYIDEPYSIDYVLDHFTGEYNLFYGKILRINEIDIEKIDFPVKFPLSKLINRCYLRFISEQRFQV